MKLGLFATTSLIAVAFNMPAMAQMSVAERLERMEKRIQHLEKRVSDQDKVIKEKDWQLKKMGMQAKEVVKQSEEDESAWFKRIELSGTLELEASHSDPFAGQPTSDLVVATAEMGLAAQVHDWVAGEITLLHEEDDTNLEVDVATVTIAQPDSWWFLTGGQFYLPFGTYETNMVSDPLTLEIGETRETAAQFGVEANGFSGSVFAFNGTNKEGTDNRIDNFGVAVGYAYESDAMTLAVTAAYINDIGDFDGLQDTISGALGSNNVVDHVGGYAVGGVATFGPFTWTAEYVTATDEFAANEVAFRSVGAKPEAWQVEAAYTFTVLKKETTFALSYQGTGEALAAGQPDERYMVGLSMALSDYVGIGLEWAHDEDYSVADGGTGNSADTVTAQFALGF